MTDNEPFASLPLGQRVQVAANERDRFVARGRADSEQDLEAAARWACIHASLVAEFGYLHQQTLEKVALQRLREGGLDPRVEGEAQRLIQDASADLDDAPDSD